MVRASFHPYDNVTVLMERGTNRKRRKALNWRIVLDAAVEGHEQCGRRIKAIPGVKT